MTFPFCLIFGLKYEGSKYEPTTLKLFFTYTYETMSSLKARFGKNHLRKNLCRNNPYLLSGKFWGQKIHNFQALITWYFDENFKLHDHSETFWISKWIYRNSLSLKMIEKVELRLFYWERKWVRDPLWERNNRINCSKIIFIYYFG